MRLTLQYMNLSHSQVHVFRHSQARKRERPDTVKESSPIVSFARTASHMFRHTQSQFLLLNLTEVQYSASHAQHPTCSVTHRHNSCSSTSRMCDLISTVQPQTLNRMMSPLLILPRSGKFGLPSTVLDPSCICLR